MARELSLAVTLLFWLACGADAGSGASEQQPGLGRRVLAVRDGRGGGSGSLLRAGLSLPEVAAARLCSLQCLQHGCISWQKMYMGLDEEEGGAVRHAGTVPATAGECLARCGMPEQEASCLAQTFHRLLNSSPLQFSCSSGCIAGLLHSSCSQCSGASGASGCRALQLGDTVQAAECLVDAAV